MAPRLACGCIAQLRGCSACCLAGVIGGERPQPRCSRYSRFNAWKCGLCICRSAPQFLQWDCMHLAIHIALNAQGVSIGDHVAVLLPCSHCLRCSRCEYRRLRRRVITLFTVLRSSAMANAQPAGPERGNSGDCKSPAHLG